MDLVRAEMRQKSRGVSQIAGNLDSFQRKVIEDAFRAAEAAAKAGGEVVIRTIDTSGAGMPHKHDPTTDARVWTGHMRSTAADGQGYRVNQRNVSEGRFSASVGFTDADEKYIGYQEEGTNKLRGMLALQSARTATDQTMKEAGF